MAKGRKATHPRALTKKQLSRRQREQRQLRWIWIGLGVVAASIVIIIAVGVISQSSRLTAVVNGERIRVADYQKRVRFWYYFYDNYLAPGYLADAEAEERTEFYRGIADQMIEETLIEQEARKRNLSVSEEETQIELEETWFQHYRVPSTPTPSPPPDPEATPTTEGTPLPTATPDTEEAFQERYQGFVESVLKPAGLNETYFRQIVQASLLRDKLEAAIIEEVPAEEEQVHLRYTVVEDDQQARDKIASFESGVIEQVNARHILVDTQQEAEEILRRLGEGEDFVALAAELSSDTSNKDKGGDLGWFSHGQMVEPFEEAAFEGEIGLYPFPVETDFGYHVIEILGHEDRPVDLDREMIDIGWLGKSQLADRFGALFAEMVFTAEIGLFKEPVPTSFGVAVVEVLEREVRQLDESEQAERRVDLFDQWLEDVREEGDIEDLWEASMVPSGL